MVVVLTVIAVGVPTTSFILQAYAQGDGWAAEEKRKKVETERGWHQ
jgi:multisubunit Na+/H+ antiporter MnhC subunit